MFSQSSFLSSVSSFVYKDKLWLDESSLPYGKYLKKNSFISSTHLLFIELNLETLLCN